MRDNFYIFVIFLVQLRMKIKLVRFYQFSIISAVTVLELTDVTVFSEMKICSQTLLLTDIIRQACFLFLFFPIKCDNRTALSHTYLM